MGISYEEAVQAQTAVEDEILKDPNVVSIGVFEEVRDEGKKTGNYVIQVGVLSPEIYQNSLKKGIYPIPREYVQGTKHIRIQVVKEGQIQSLHSKAIEKQLPSAKDELPLNNGGSTSLERQRPVPCGHSIGHPTVTAGTIGLLLKYTESPNSKNAYILSNNHVLAANNAAYIGDEIIQPATIDSGRVGKDTIGILHRWVPLRVGQSNMVDAAVAEVCGGYRWSNYVAPHISKIGSLSEISNAMIGMQVEKNGRTTGYTQGEILSINESIKVIYTSIGILTFKNQIRTTLMSRGGDSGSALVERDTKSPIGLLFAGSDGASYFNHINSAIRLLSNEWVNQYPSRSITFEKTYPFTIIRRSYSTSSYPSNPSQKLFCSKNKTFLLADYRKVPLINILFNLRKNQSAFEARAIHTASLPMQPLTFQYGRRPNVLRSPLCKSLKAIINKFKH